MSRTHAQASYGFRTFGIAGFIVAASFFINAVPALAASVSGSDGVVGSSSSEQAHSNSSNTSFNGNGFQENAPGLEQQLKQLQKRIKKLDEMKAQLQKLLISLQQRASTTPERPVCPTTPGQVASSTRSHPGCRPEIKPSRTIPCSANAHAEISFSRQGATTPPCRTERDYSRGTTTCRVSYCLPNGVGTPWNHGSTTPYGSPTTWKERTSSSSNAWFNAGGGSTDRNGSFYGQVRGASSDMSAEMSDTLDSLKSDLLDISDILNQ